MPALKNISKRTNHNILVALAIFMLPFALTVDVNAQIRYVFDHIGMEDGLSSNKVNQINMDSRGYIWISTDNGLNRFDGYRMRQYFTSFDPKNIHSNSFRSVNEDGNRVLWVGVKHNDYTLYHMDQDRFDCDVDGYLKRLGLKKPNPNHRIKVDENKNLWVRGDNGLDNYDFGKKSWKHYNIPNIEKIFVRDKKAYLVQRDLTIKIISFDTGSIATDLSLKQQAKNFNSERLHIFVDTRHGIWISNRMHDQLLHKEPGADVWHQFKEGTDCTKLDVNFIDESPYGTIMIAMGHQSICYYDPESRTIRETDKTQIQLPSGTVNYARKLGNSVWIGYEREGLAVTTSPLPGLETPYLKSNESALANKMNTTSFAADNNKNVWIATDGDGIYVMDFYANLKRHFNLENKLNVVVSLFKDRKGRIWACTYKDGVYIFDNVNATPLHIKGGERGLADDNVWCAKEDHRGNVWIGNLLKGVQMWDEEQKCFLPPAVKDVTVSDITLSPDSVFIVATPDGHIDFDYKTGRVWNCGFDDMVYRKYNIKDKGITRVTFDSRHWLWEGGNNGLIIRNKSNNTYLHIGHKEGLANEVIHGIVEDAEHNMWISTEYGIARIIIDENAKSPSLEKMHIQNFSTHDGLMSNLFNAGALYAGGRFVLAGSTNGYCTIRPKLVPKTQEKYKVVITELYLGPDSCCAAVDTNMTYRIKNNEPHIRVCYSTLNSRAITKMRYAYRLNSDDEWAYTNSTELIFSHLAPGNYTLELCQLAESERPCQCPTRLHLYVCYPWWLTWWAITLYALVAIAILATSYILRKKMKLLKTNILELQNGFLLGIEKYQNERIRESIKPSEVEVANEDEEFKKRVVKVIEAHIDDCDFTVEQLSHELGMSRANLHRKLVAISGRGPLGVIRLIRLRRSQQLLEKSQMTIAEISYAVGINNPKNFSRYFKEEFGVTPTQYREGKLGEK